jgi:hypothetical protein
MGDRTRNSDQDYWRNPLGARHFYAEFLAIAAMVVQHFLGIAPQVPSWLTGGVVFSVSRVVFLSKAAEAEVDWLHRRVLALELRVSFLSKSNYHPETYTREAVKNFCDWAPTVYQLFDANGGQCAVRFNKLPRFVGWETSDGKFMLMTDLEPKEVAVDEDEPHKGKTYRYGTRVLEGVTKQELLDYVRRAAQEGYLGLGPHVLFER